MRLLLPLFCCLSFVPFVGAQTNRPPMSEEALRLLENPEGLEQRRAYAAQKRAERAQMRAQREAMAQAERERVLAAEAAWAERINALARETTQNPAETSLPIYGMVERPELSAEPIPVYRWPRTRPLPARISVEGQNEDGTVFNYTHVRLPNLHIATMGLESWSLSDRRTDTSFTLRHNLFPSLNLSLFAYPAQTFLPVLTERHLLGYVLGLERLYGDEFVAEDLTTILDSANFLFHEESVHRFAYERLIPREDPTAEPFRYAQEDFLILLPEGCFIFRLEGPPTQVAQVRGDVTAFLEGFVSAERLAEAAL